MLKSHYAFLSATYLQNGMKNESSMFALVADDFAQIEADTLKPDTRKRVVESWLAKG